MVFMNNITKTKTLLEAKEGPKNDPLVFSYEDQKGEKMLGHMDLHTAAHLYGLNMEEVVKTKGFYEGNICKFKSSWSTLKGYVYIQIANHSKWKK